MSLFLLDKGDHSIDVRDLDNEELRGHLAWFRDWLEGSEHSDPQEFIDYIDTMRSAAAQQAVVQQATLEPIVKANDHLQAEMVNDFYGAKYLSVSVHKIVEQIEHGTSSLADTAKLRSKVWQIEEEIDNLSQSIRQKKHASEDLADDFAAHAIFRNLYLEETGMWNEVEVLAERMIALEAEFDRRNKLEKTVADIHAWTLGKESTWTVPTLPKYIHAGEYCSTADAQVQWCPISPTAKMAGVKDNWMW